MKTRIILCWVLLLIVALPPIISSPLAILNIDPVKSVYEGLHYPPWIVRLIGITQLLGGILIIIPRTYRIGWWILLAFGLLILLSKGLTGQLQKGIEEMVLLTIMLVLSWLGHPRNVTKTSLS